MLSRECGVDASRGRGQGGLGNVCATETVTRMGYHIALEENAPRDQAGDRRRSVKVGSYGSQEYMMALLVAGYATGDNPESKRACGWVEVQAGAHKAGVLDDLGQRYGRNPYDYRHLRNRPVLISELISANQEDSTWIAMSQNYDGQYTYELGRKFKPFADPNLEALAAFADKVLDGDPVQSVDAASVATLAPVIRAAVNRLGASCWYETMNGVAEVFETAAALGCGIEMG